MKFYESEVVIKCSDDNTISEEEYMNKLIKECIWRKDIGDGIIICKGLCGPCQRIIDTGKCDTMIEYFKTKKIDYIYEQEEREEE